MADEIENQPLPEFVLNCIDDLNSGSLSPEEAFVAMRQYKPLRDLLDQQKDVVAANLSSPEEAKKVFLSILEKERVIAGKEPEALDNPISQKEIVERARAFQEARVRTDSAIKNKLTNLERERKTYVGRVTAAWVTELRNRRLYDVSPNTIENKILQATETLPAATTKEATQTALGSALSDAIQTDATLSPHKEALRAVTQTIEAPDVFIEAATIREQTNRIILESPDIARPDLLVTFITQGVDSARALSLTQVAEGLSLDINPAVDPTRPSVFFRAVATSPLQKLIAPAADAILTVLPQETRETIIEGVIEHSWNQLTKTPEGIRKLQERFGAEVVNSPAFQKLIADGNAAFSARPPGVGGIFGAFNRVATDVAVTVSGTGPDPSLMNVLDVQRRTGIPPGNTTLPTGVTSQLTWYQLYVVMAYSKVPELFHSSFSAGRWALDWVGRKAVGKVAGVAVKAAATKLSGTAIASVLGTAVGGPIGTVIGAVLGFVGGKLLSPLINGAKSLVSNILGGGLIKRLFSGEQGRWQDDFPLVAAAAVILPIIILFLLPTFLNPQFIGNASQSSALANLGGGNEEEGGSAYIIVTKTASPNSFPDNNPGDVSYSISVKATAGDLNNIRISDVFAVFGGTTKITPPPISGAPSSLADGESFSTTVSVSLAGLKDSLVTNTITVTADVKTINGDTKTGETRSTSASVSIGKPPTGCFVFSDAPTHDAFGFTSGPWDDKSAILNAIATLSRSSSYMAQLCSGGPISLWRVRADFGGGSVSGPNGIFLYNAGVRGLSALYTLAHESGHVLSWRTGLFSRFHNEGIWRREGSLWTYPGYSGYTESEDFAETIADYVVYKVYVFKKGTARFSFLPRYPLHYDFAKSIFGIEY